MKQVTTIPNEPQQMVAVSFFRRVQLRFGPRAGQVLWAPVAFVGSSALEVSAEEAGSREATRLPIVWRFIAGQGSGGDDLKTEPAWHERRVEIPRDVTDAAEYLQHEEFEGTDFRWYLLDKASVRL